MTETKPGGRLIKAGAIGSAVLALCCFTPILVVLFSAIGLGAWIGGLDAVLLPLLAVFLGVLGFGLWRRYLGSA